MAGRIRTVKPEWLEDEKLAGASDAARVLSIGMILLADDYGNFRADIRYLKAQVWGLSGTRGRKATDARAELERIGFVELYVVEGEQYGHVRTWNRHQRLDRRGKPRVPEPGQQELPIDGRGFAGVPRKNLLRSPTGTGTPTVDMEREVNPPPPPAIMTDRENTDPPPRSCFMVGAITQTFLTLYERYPQKAGKATAAAEFQRWASVNGGEEAFARRLHAIWDWQLKTEKFARLEFTKELANYLADRRWEDDPPEEPDIAVLSGYPRFVPGPRPTATKEKIRGE